MVMRLPRFGWMAAAFAAAGCAAATASAQVTVRLRTDYRRYLLFEPIVIRVRVENGTREPLVFTGDAPNAEMVFDVERAPGEFVRANDAPVFTAPFEVPGFGHGVVAVELLRLFDLPESGPLAVAVRVKTGAEEFASGKLLLDLVPGLELARMDVRMPGDPAERRSFQLRSIGRDNAEHLLLRVDDTERRLCVGVFDLGKLIRQRPPQMMMGGDGVFHVLHQSAPVRLTQSIYRDDRRRLETVFHGVIGLDARLARDEAGNVRVLGAGPYTGDPIVAPMRAEEGRPPDRLPDRAKPPR